MIGSTRKSIEAIGAEKSSEHQSIARKFLQVFLGAGERCCRPPLDRGSENLNMLTLALGRLRHKLSSSRRHGARLRILGVKLVHSRAGNVSKSKIRISFDRTIKRFARPHPSRKNAINTFQIGGRR